MQQFPQLLAPGQIGNLTLRNRIVLAPMGSNFASADGHCNERLIAYYEARARGGAGLLMLETSAACFPNGATMPNTVAFSRDEFLPGLTELTRRVHSHGARIFAQLNHGGKMAQEDTAAGRPIGLPTVTSPARSDMFNVLTESEIGHFVKAAGPDGEGPQYYAMTAEDIADTVARFADAARRAKQAGFDGVEIHAGHGYLIASFLSPASNHREDDYGGSPENRARFLVEIYTGLPGSHRRRLADRGSTGRQRVPGRRRYRAGTLPGDRPPGGIRRGGGYRCQRLRQYRPRYCVYRGAAGA